MGQRRAWTFLSNHAHVIIALAKEPSLRVRDLAAVIGVTERAVSTILTDLEAAGVLVRGREGRRNVYVINPEAPLRHSVESHRNVRDLLQLAEVESGGS
jgi:DNA-binding transcriptional regulator PaaX